jgi:hypothetical protein
MRDTVELPASLGRVGHDYRGRHGVAQGERRRFAPSVPTKVAPADRAAAPFKRASKVCNGRCVEA